MPCRNCRPGIKMRVHSAVRRGRLPLFPALRDSLLAVQRIGKPAAGSGEERLRRFHVRTALRVRRRGNPPVGGWLPQGGHKGCPYVEQPLWEHGYRRIKGI
jgi:hypothetical protein